MLKSYTAKYLHEHLKGITWMNWCSYTVFIPGSFRSIQLNTFPSLSSSNLECWACGFPYGVFWDLVLEEPSLYSKWTFFRTVEYLLLETLSLVRQLSKCCFLLYSLCFVFVFFVSFFPSNFDILCNVRGESHRILKNTWVERVRGQRG